MQLCFFSIHDLGMKHKRGSQKIEWKRPHEFCDKPVFFDKETSRHEVCQGEVEDCYFISILSAIADIPDVLKQVSTKRFSYGFPYFIQFYELEKILSRAHCKLPEVNTT